MFPNESSSNEIYKTNALKIKFYDANLNTKYVPEGVAENPLAGLAHFNEAHRRPVSATAPHKPQFPTDQVPDQGDTGAHCHDKIPVSGRASPQLEPVAAHEVAMTIPAGGCGISDTNISGLGSGEENSAVCHEQSKHLHRVTRVGAGAGPSSVSHPVETHVEASSVITSSAPSCHGTEAEPPSLATNLGAQQSFNAMLASHLGSSNSNSLSCQDAQSNHSDVSFTDMDPTHVSQAIENPNKSCNQVQDIFSTRSCKKQCRKMVKAEEEEVMTCSSASPGQAEGEGVLRTIGALSVQDKFKFNSKKIGMTMSLPSAVRGVTPAATNIPSLRDNTVNLYATVQGISDSNPLLSFNNRNAKNNITIYSEEERAGPASNVRWGIPRGLGLRGGGESSSSWGTPPSGGSAAGSGWGGSGGSSGQTGGASSGGSQGQWSGNSNAGNQSSGSNSMNRGPGSGQGQSTSGQNNSGNSGKNSGGSTGSQSQGSGGNQQNNQGNQQNNSSGRSGPAGNGSTSWAQAAGKGLSGSQQGQQQPPQQQQQQQQQQQEQQSGSSSGGSSSGGAGGGSNSGGGGSGGSGSGGAGAGGGSGSGSNIGGGGSNNSGSNGNNGNGSGGSGPSGSSGSTTSSTSTSTKQQLEQLNTMREALFSQDGWGGQHVNQDTGWDIPASPEPGIKDGVPVWKPNVNNGTDLWEANLRNGGQPPPSATQKTPWGHTPSSNIGGTWGEDDDVSDSSNVWTGVPPAGAGPAPGATGAQWSGGSGAAAAAAAAAAAGMWGGPKKESEWSGGTGSSGWGDPRSDPRADPRSDPRAALGDPRGDPRLDPRELRPGGGGGGGGGGAGELRGSAMLDPREHMRGAGGGGGGGGATVGDPRTDPRALGARLNGAGPTGPDGVGMWGGAAHGGVPQHHHGGGPHHAATPTAAAAAVAAAAAAVSKLGPGGAGGAVGQWAGPPPKELALANTGKPTGWEEPSPPAQRRNIPNYDDGTSLWGNPAQQQNRVGGKVSHWKDMPTPNMSRSGNMQCPPGMSQNRIPGNGTGNMKPDNAPLWVHPGRNGSWGEGQHETAGPGWGEEPKNVGASGVNSWSEPPLTPTSWGPKPKNTLTPGGWDAGDMDASSWGHAPKQQSFFQQGQKPLTKDMVWASKQFRILADMGFKKEDVENALRSNNMNFEDAHEQLNTRLSVADAWRRQEVEHVTAGPFDLGHTGGGPGFTRYNPVQQQQQMFPPPGGGGVGGGPNLLNNLGNSGNGGVGGNPAALGGVNSLSPAVVQKMLSAQQGSGPGPIPGNGGTGASGGPFGQAPRAPSSQPSTAQLRMLVQQIQMAVQAGYLNHQILNQPLAPQTLLLLNQLLQQIKILQQFVQQQTVVQMQPHKGGSSSAVLQISVQITKTKQQISNLQNQIASQQAIYVKQQQQQQQHLGGPGAGPQGPPHPAGPPDFFKPHDPLQTLGANFSDLALSKEQGSFQSQQQSRLNQWKLPALDKDDGTGNEFSRAPGTTTKQSLAQSHSSPNMNPLLGQGDSFSLGSTWSSVGRPSDSGWPDSGSSDTGAGDNKEPWPTVTSQASVAVNAAAFTDLVPEFEPGKPWKGTQMKSIEDDPTITPGSVVRSPLSLAAIKDSELFSAGGGSKTSPTVSVSEPPLPPLSLSNSTWSFTPAPQNSGSLSKLGGAKVWGEAPPPTPVTSELWGAPMGKARGPPPGLGSKGAGGGGGSGGGSSNGWGGGGGRGGGGGGGAGGWGGAASGWAPQASAWLLLRNLTPQIDGSTLKTLCVQHGPLQNFHLYLNHGIALAKYSTREEANKAQGALNNCVLGNTTIFAESPGDSDVHALLQHLNHGAQQQAGAPQGGGGGAGGNSWGLRGNSGAGVGQPSGSSAGPQNKNPGPGTDTWSTPGAGSQLWPTGPSAGSLWGGNGPLDAAGADQHRATPSSLNSFLPGDLLGGESM